MKKFTKILLSFASILLPFSLAIASTIPLTPSVFETALTAPQQTTDTTLTLANGNLVNGNPLNGFVCLTIDSGQANLEYECGTAVGPAVSGLVRGIDPLTGTSTVASLVFTHRRGADVKITDFPFTTIIGRILSGIDTLPNVISYATSTATSTLNGANIPSVAYVNAQTSSASSSAVATLLSSNNTWAGINTYTPAAVFTGGFTSNATSTLSKGALLGSGYDCGTGSLNTQMCAKAYIDSVAVAGASNANDTTKGIVQTATAAQAAAGTSIGSTGARLTLGANISATVSPGAANTVVVSNTSGKIDPSFLNGTENYAFGGNDTFTSFLGGNIKATSTNATTTVGSPAVPILDIGKNIQIFTSDGNFSVPVGITKIYAQVIGGGAGSGAASGNTGPGSGGGSGGYVEGIFDVSATSTVHIAIGLGGQNSAGTTFLSGMASSTGGTGGAGTTNSSQPGGAAGIGHVATAFLSTAIASGGMPGGNSIIGTGSVSGSGGSSPFGGGGTPLNSTSAGINGTGYGSGGSGGFGLNQSGSNGANGVVIIRY